MSISIYVGKAGTGVRVPIASHRVVALALRTLKSERVASAMISVAFVSRRRIAELNREHLQKRGPTDVIAFGMSAGGKRRAEAVVGDIYICPDVARSNAQRFGTLVREEISRLVIHGTLHVIGYDHAEGAARTASAMWKKQEAILAWASAKSRSR